MRLRQFFVAAFILLGPVQLSGIRAFAEENCFTRELKQKIGVDYPETLGVLKHLQKFAKKNDLPQLDLEVGPPDRRVLRHFVGIDINNKELLHNYMQTFNLGQPLAKDAAGTLVLDFQHEDPGYTTGMLRTSGDPDQPIYRWGRPDLSWNVYWNGGGTAHAYAAKYNIKAYEHLIGLNEAEQKNVLYYLDHPEERGPVKSNNCIAWTSSIELGTTGVDIPLPERKPLFTCLGMSRATPHFEIGRRLMHASNERHRAVAVFYDGEKGLEDFKNLAQHLPPEPQSAYKDILHGYKPTPKVEITEAIDKIPDGAKIFIPIAAGASPEGLGALMERAKTLDKGFDIHVLVNGISEAAMTKGIDEGNGKVRVHALFLGGNARKLYAEGKVSVIPGYLGDFTRFVRDPTKPQFHYDAILVRVAPADENGHYSLGPNNDMIMSIIRNRPGIKVIAEVNEKIPRTRGANFLTKAQITATFKSEAALAGPPQVPLSDVEKEIGVNLGKIIDSGATLQLGIGNVFGGLPEGLRNSHRVNLKIHSEMFGDPLREIMQSGLAHEAKTGFAYGSQELYQWLDKNQNVEFVETEVVNDPGAVQKIPQFHAVNTALQVNLRGDVNATIGADGKRMSSPGGQVEFMSGAAKSEKGKAIIAIRSTAKDGQLSAIVLDLYQGPVTTPHESVTHVVTEYGIAELAGKSERERAINLIKIAHPKFRKQLIDEAIRRGLVQPQDERLIFPEVDKPQVWLQDGLRHGFPAMRHFNHSIFA